MPVNSLLLIGVVIAQSTPTTVSSNVVMTKNANGNEASGKDIFRDQNSLGNTRIL
jgi:predicted Na+-dependent transporter